MKRVAQDREFCSQYCFYKRNSVFREKTGSCADLAMIPLKHGMRWHDKEPLFSMALSCLAQAILRLLNMNKLYCSTGLVGVKFIMYVLHLIEFAFVWGWWWQIKVRCIPLCLYFTSDLIYFVFPHFKITSCTHFIITPSE